MPAMIGIIPNEVLNNAVKIPVLGFGTLLYSVSWKLSIKSTGYK